MMERKSYVPPKAEIRHKRLTIRNSDGTVSQPTWADIESVFYRLAYYEDLMEQGRLVILPFPLGCSFRHNLDLRMPQEGRDYWELHHNLSVAIQGTRHGDGERSYFPLDAFRVGNQLWENTLVSEKDGDGNG